MKSKTFVIQAGIVGLVSALFVLWGAEFIAQSSFRTLEGVHSYSLFDDAMISMRYAWNFSHGNGLVWNPGEYVQGYTNLLMTLIMSAATLFLSKSSAVLAIQILGVILMLLMAFLALRISDRFHLGVDGKWRAAAGILAYCVTLAYYPLAYWSLMGMETGLLTVLLLAALAALFQYVQSGSLYALLLSAFFFGLAFLTRNESILFFILAWIYLAWSATGSGTHVRIRQMVVASSVVALIVLGELVFQYLYYGEFLPNTYTLKLVGMPMSYRLENGLSFIQPFMKESAWLLVLAAASVIRNFRKEKLFLLSIVLTAILYQIYIGGDAWNYWRIMAPAIPAALILDIDFLTGSARDIIKALTSRRPVFIPRLPAVNALAMLFMVLVMGTGIGFADAPFQSQIIFQEKPYQQHDNRHNVNTAIALNRILRKDATIGVTWAGALPYYTDFKAIDFLGKADRYIAQLSPDLSGSSGWNGMSSVPGHNKYDLSYSIITLKPTYVERFGWGNQDVTVWADSHYIEAEYKRQRLFLLKGSPDVLWENLKLHNAGGESTP